MTQFFLFSLACLLACVAPLSSCSSMTPQSEAPTQSEWTVASPDGNVILMVKFTDFAGVGDYPKGKSRLYYRVDYGGQTLLGWSPLGIERSDQEFVDGLILEAAPPVAATDATYTMPHGKRRICRDHFHERSLAFRNPAGSKVELILRAYDDGVAFRYRFPEESKEARTVKKELTGFALPSAARLWAHPYDEATEYSPAYETYCEVDVPAGTPSPKKAGWAFPVLFRAGAEGPWGLITEASVDRTYCGSRLEQDAPHCVYRLRFPDEGEGNHTGAVAPSWTLPWMTPWRVVYAAPSVARIVESTLVQNLNPPSVLKDSSWIVPGRASWSWLSDHDSPQDGEKLKKFVDLAAEMGWEYTLVDANWDIMRNGNVHDVIAHGKAKGVGALLWYNSGGEHNYVTEKPRGCMAQRQVRRKEMQLLKSWGVRGVKVDFFQSDKQNIMALYQDILEDAAEFQVLVNFHGCTLPRGWSRTYPHLMSMEAVRGAECYSFDKAFTEKAPVHNATIPFTRNAVGPVDYTPVMFLDNVYPHITTSAHELALSVVFESGWLHFADSVEAYLKLPEAPRGFLKRVPAAWDDTRCLAGEPGKYVVIARRHGEEWFVGGINGEGKQRELSFALGFLDRYPYAMQVIADAAEGRGFESSTKGIPGVGVARVDLKLRPYGGFVLDLTPQSAPPESR